MVESKHFIFKYSDVRGLDSSALSVAKISENVNAPYQSLHWRITGSFTGPVNGLTGPVTRVRARLPFDGMPSLNGRGKTVAGPGRGISFLTNYRGRLDCPPYRAASARVRGAGRQAPPLYKHESHELQAMRDGLSVADGEHHPHHRHVACRSRRASRARSSLRPATCTASRCGPLPRHGVVPGVPEASRVNE